MKKTIFIITAIFIAQCSFAFYFPEKEEQSRESIFDLLSRSEIKEVTFTFDVEGLLKDRKNEEAFPALFSYQDVDGSIRSWNIKINQRGRFRRSRCTEMPPLKLNFKKGDLEDAGLAKFDDFKLVTQCIEDGSSAKEFLLKEFIAYKMYNQLTDYSFRVHFLKVNYVDQTSGVVRSQYGFLIEDTAQLRHRLQANKFDSLFNIERDRIAKVPLKTVSVFQYMIGNLDWDVKKRFHNIKPIEIDGKIIPVPYDFDFSGLVSASYALLNPNYQVKSIKDRLYLGYEEDLADLEETLRLFESKRTDILNCIKTCKALPRDSRFEMIRYINSFYKELDNIKLPIKLTAN